MNITNGTGPVSTSSTLSNTSISNLNDLKQQQHQQMNSSNNWPLNPAAVPPPPQSVPNPTTTTITATPASATTTTSSTVAAATTASTPLPPVQNASAPQNESKFRIIKTDTNVNRSTDAELTDSSILTGLVGSSNDDASSSYNNINMLNTNSNSNTPIANNVSTTTNNGTNGVPLITNAAVDNISHQQYQRGRWRVTDYTPEQQPMQTNTLANVSLPSNSDTSTILNSTAISTNTAAAAASNTSNNNPNNGTLIGNSSVGSNLNGLISSKLNQPQATQSNTSISSNQFDASFGHQSAVQQLKHITSSVSLAGSVGVTSTSSTVTAATSLQQLPTATTATTTSTTSATVTNANTAQSSGNLSSTSTTNTSANFANIPPLATQSQINLPTEYLMSQATADVNAQTGAYLLNSKNIGSLPALVVQSPLPAAGATPSPLDPALGAQSASQYITSGGSNLVTLQKQTSVVANKVVTEASNTSTIPAPTLPALTSQTSPKEQSLIKNLNQPQPSASASTTNTTNSSTSISSSLPTVAQASSSIQNQPPMSFLMSPLANSTNIIDNAVYANSNTNSINELAKDFISDLSSDNERKTMIDSGIHMRIEQAMDMVKSHLTTAVRSEIVALKNQIKQLKELCTRLEQENTILRQHASPDTLKLIENRNILNQSANSAVTSSSSSSTTTTTSIQSNMNVGQSNATSGTSSPAPVNFEPITKSLPHEANIQPQQSQPQQQQQQQQQQPVLNGPNNPLGNELGMHDSMISSFTEHVVTNNAYNSILSQSNVIPDNSSSSSLILNHQLDSSNDF